METGPPSMSERHSWYQVVIFLHLRALVAMLGSHAERSLPDAISRLTANVESWEQLDITFHRCRLLLPLTLLAVFVVEPINNRSRWIVSSVGFVLSTRHYFVNGWNCCWPIFCAFLTASTADGSTISLLSRTGRSSLSSSNWLPSPSHFARLLSGHGGAPHLVFQWSGVHLQSPQPAQQPQCASYHPQPEGTRIVCKTYRPSITLDASIMCFIDGDCREDHVGLLNREIASIKLSDDIWMSR